MGMRKWGKSASFKSFVSACSLFDPMMFLFLSFTCFIVISSCCILLLSTEKASLLESRLESNHFILRWIVKSLLQSTTPFL